ncbi:MAG: Stp1/IreP family PP2C-type Ser/Thr phosphatase [Proteobacteria bacterium]|nr:Stp1/IreP family PP2C-type Ser/Thr phosphatase [Pseudomonadota bacterium]
MKPEEALEIVALTDSGRVRAHNEDSIALDDTCGLAVLADGMGGYSAGEVASAIAVKVMVNEITRPLKNANPTGRDEETGEELAVALLARSIHSANTEIYKEAQDHTQYAGMGTTIVAALFYDNRVVVGHVGDSRLYRLRGGALQAITRDHSLLQEQIDCGMISVENARHSQNKNLVTRAVGIDAEVIPEIHLYAVEVGDVYLLCSDGLNDMLEDEAIQVILNAMQGNLALAAQQLIEAANDKGGRDNISVILIGVKHEFAQQRGLLATLLDWFRR